MKTKITITNPDIIFEKVDAIINAANSRLSHYGGVALAISKAAGPELQAYCNKYINEKGEIQVAENIVTNG